VLDSSESGIGGIKEAVILIEGDKVYSKMKHESGVHRVQRVPQTKPADEFILLRLPWRCCPKLKKLT